MNDQVKPTNISLSLTDLEKMMRRVVREELARLIHTRPDILKDWSHEGSEDPAGDERALQLALETYAQYQENSQAWTPLEELKNQEQREGTIAISR